MCSHEISADAHVPVNQPGLNSATKSCYLDFKVNPGRVVITDVLNTSKVTHQALGTGSKKI